MSELQGRRITIDDQAEGFRWDDVKPGDYWPVKHGNHHDLWFRDPAGNIGRCCKHTITEHEDGTFTVDPSIADRGEAGFWHGYLRRGVWSW